MKLRCTQNSIRLRLRKADIELLENNGFVIESLFFQEGLLFKYELRLEKIKTIQAFFNQGMISVQLPKEVGTQWIKTEQISLETHQNVDENKSLHILIEKDFPCSHQPSKDNTGSFHKLASKRKQLK